MTGKLRLAIGSLQASTSHDHLLWGLLDLLSRDSGRPQLFGSRCHHSPRDAARVICGSRQRYLDSWLMSRRNCRRLAAVGSAGRDAVIVEGTWDDREPSGESPRGGNLASLRRWLDLPAIGVVDVRRLDPCQVPPRPPVDALLLDGFTSRDQFREFALRFETLWRLPVLGGLPDIPVLRDVLEHLSPWANPARSLCRRLGDALAEFLDLRQFFCLAGSSSPDFEVDKWSDGAETDWLAGRKVAVALDECFTGPFPETLELLEHTGARCCDFSPLRQEHLPLGTDLVVFGECRLQSFATVLAGNYCLWRSLRKFVAEGGRVYAEGTSLALLARSAAFADGDCWRMAGILPGDAIPTPRQLVGQPVEMRLGAGEPPLRGYRGQWIFQPARRGPVGDQMLWRRDSTCASIAPIHFAAQPAWLISCLQATSKRQVPLPVL